MTAPGDRSPFFIPWKAGCASVPNKVLGRLIATILNADEFSFTSTPLAYGKSVNKELKYGKRQHLRVFARWHGFSVSLDAIFRDCLFNPINLKLAQMEAMKVKFLNRNTILMNIRSNLDIVKWMTKNDYDTTVVEPVHKFMKAYSERKHLFDKINIRYDNADNFVSDLVAHKIIEFR